jgi:hypothetical protein
MGRDRSDTLSRTERKVSVRRYGLSHGSEVDVWVGSGGGRDTVIEGKCFGVFFLLRMSFHSCFSSSIIFQYGLRSRREANPTSLSCIQRSFSTASQACPNSSAQRSASRMTMKAKGRAAAQKSHCPVSMSRIPDVYMPRKLQTNDSGKTTVTIAKA